MNPQKINFINTQQGQNILITKAKSISNGCHQFIQQIVSMTNMNKYSLINQVVHYSANFKDYFQYPKQITCRPICAKPLYSKDFAFRCYSCQMQKNSIICQQCFSKSDHKGHNYQKINGGGCCDCGDDEKWNSSGSCTQHNKTQYNIIIDQDICKKFINDFQFVIQILTIFDQNQHFSGKQSIENIMKETFVHYLLEFNENSMINNQICFKLFSINFNTNFIESLRNNNNNSKDQNNINDKSSITVLHALFNLYKDNQFCKNMNNVFIAMFTRPKFKKFLTSEYNKIMNNNSLIVESQFSEITCQIFTSHKSIQQLLQTNTFEPITISKLDPNISFGRIANIYHKIYLYLSYLVNLYNGVGSMYVEYHLKYSNLSNLTSYQSYIGLDPQIMNCYGIEHIYFTHLFPFLSLAQSNKQLILKAIIDIVNNFQNNQHKTIELFQPKQRTLMVLIYLYFNGQIQKAINCSFLQTIGLIPQLLYRILQSNLFVIRFYALILSNKQTADRYDTFSQYSVLNNTHIIFSIDIQLFKFCVLSLNLYPQFQFQSIPETTLVYEPIITFAQNKFSIPSLFSIPTMQIINQLGNIQQTSDDNYDRKKALLYLTDYLGIFLQTCITNHSQLNLKTQLNSQNPQQITQSLGSLLLSLGQIKIEEFKDIKNIFFSKNVSIDNFIKQHCEISNKKIKIKTSSETHFHKFNISYLTSKKHISCLLPYLQHNHNTIPPQNIPISTSKPTLNKLKQLILNQNFIQKLLQILQQYMYRLTQSNYILEHDLVNLQKYIEQLIRIQYLLQTNTIKQHIKNIFHEDNFSQMIHKFSLSVTTQISNLIGTNALYHNVNNIENQSQVQQRKSKLKQLKSKKMTKLHEKQKLALTALTPKLSQQLQQFSQSQTCLFCKTSQKQQPLSIMCYSNPTSLFSKQYLEYDKNFNIITSCGHMTHYSCHKQINKQQIQFYCNFCKTFSNLLIQKTKIICLQKLQKQQQNQSYNLIQQTLVENYLKQCNQQYNEIQLTYYQVNIQSIIHSIMYSIIIDFQFFIKSMAKPFSFIIRKIISTQINVVNLVQSTLYLFEKSNPQKKQFWIIYIKTMYWLLQNLKLDHKSKQIIQNLSFKQENLPQGFQSTIQLIIKSLISQESFHSLEELTILPYCTPKFYSLPPTLAQLSIHIGQCPCCKRMTNQICLCLQCSFISCLHCESQNLNEHTKAKHPQGTIFIQVDTGKILYLYQQKICAYKQIYKNWIGQIFIISQTKNKQNYLLQQQQYKNIKIDIIKHKIQQKIKYWEVGRTN